MINPQPFFVVYMQRSPKILILKIKKGSSKIFLMSAAPVSREKMEAYLRLYLKIEMEKIIHVGKG